MNDIRDTLNERGKKYGEFKDHAEISNALLDCLIRHHNSTDWDCLKPFHKEALRMICHKLGRIINGDPDYDDSWRDIAGYATLVVDILNSSNLTTLKLKLSGDGKLSEISSVPKSGKDNETSFAKTRKELNNEAQNIFNYGDKQCGFGTRCPICQAFQCNCPKVG